jgi:hypothetical protein
MFRLGRSPEGDAFLPEAIADGEAVLRGRSGAFRLAPPSPQGAAAFAFDYAGGLPVGVSPADSFAVGAANYYYSRYDLPDAVELLGAMAVEDIFCWVEGNCVHFLSPLRQSQAVSLRLLFAVVSGVSIGTGYEYRLDERFDGASVAYIDIGDRSLGARRFLPGTQPGSFEQDGREVLLHLAPPQYAIAAEDEMTIAIDLQVSLTPSLTAIEMELEDRPLFAEMYGRPLWYESQNFPAPCRFIWLPDAIGDEANANRNVGLFYLPLMRPAAAASEKLYSRSLEAAAIPRAAGLAIVYQRLTAN